MARHNMILRAVTAPLAVLAISTLLKTAPESVRWALLICSMGFVGVTLRLRQLDAGL